jgi:hypothetical protein
MVDRSNAYIIEQIFNFLAKSTHNLRNIIIILIYEALKNPIYVCRFFVGAEILKLWLENIPTFENLKNKKVDL